MAPGWGVDPHRNEQMIWHLLPGCPSLCSTHLEPWRPDTKFNEWLSLLETEVLEQETFAGLEMESKRLRLCGQRALFCSLAHLASKQVYPPELSYSPIKQSRNICPAYLLWGSKESLMRKHSENYNILNNCSVINNSITVDISRVNGRWEKAYWVTSNRWCCSSASQGDGEGGFWRQVSSVNPANTSSYLCELQRL